jgi:hypothetical protein
MWDNHNAALTKDLPAESSWSTLAYYIALLAILHGTPTASSAAL